MNQFMLGYSFIKLPLNDSICRLSVGVPGIIELDFVEVRPGIRCPGYKLWSVAGLVRCDSPRAALIFSTSLQAWLPLIGLSAQTARLSLPNVSSIVRARDRFPLYKWKHMIRIPAFIPCRWESLLRSYLGFSSHVNAETFDIAVFPTVIRLNKDCDIACVSQRFTNSFGSEFAAVTAL